MPNACGVVLGGKRGLGGQHSLCGTLSFCPTRRGARTLFLRLDVSSACVTWICWNRIDTPHASEGGDLRKARHECFVNNCTNRWVELDILSTQKSLFQSEFPHLRIVPLISTIKNTYHMLNSLFSSFEVKLHILWNPLLFRHNWN